MTDTITLRQLRYFRALAQHLHFGKAADAVAVTQPALSMQIKALEEELGVQLVERHQRTIMLTEEGKKIAHRASEILSAVRELAEYARHLGKPLAGPLRLGVIPSIAPYLLPLILPALQNQYPDLEPRLRETLTDILLAELDSGELDLLLLALPVETKDIETMELFVDRFFLAVRSTPDLSPSQRVTPEKLASERLLLLEEGHCLRDQALSYCHMVHPESLSSFGATSLATIIQMVANGYGVTLLPEICASIEIKDDRIALLQFRKPEPQRTIGLAWRRTSPRKPDFIAFGKLIRDIAQENWPARRPAI